MRMGSACHLAVTIAMDALYRLRRLIWGGAVAVVKSKAVRSERYPMVEAQLTSQRWYRGRSGHTNVALDSK
jgi:hypothetical protein